MEEKHRSVDEWLDLIYDRIEDPNPSLLELALQFVDQHPTEPQLLWFAALIGVLCEKPDLALRYLHRLRKRYALSAPDAVVQAIAVAQQGNWAGAKALLEREGIRLSNSSVLFPPGTARALCRGWVKRILLWKPEERTTRKEKSLSDALTKTQSLMRKKNEAMLEKAPELKPKVPHSAVQPLPLPIAQIPITFTIPDHAQYSFLEKSPDADLEDFLLRMDFARISMLKGFDDLLCLDQLSGIDHYWYQVETVRKVLKQFRGRVMLADEVGLGKTIEAGMVLKEYLLRGMVERVLILTPASLVGQWQEEMERKFGIEFRTTHESLLHRDGQAFWNQPRIIASIAVARRPPHYGFVTNQRFDMVIVDEAHHLKNRSTKNWQLVDALQKRFLLLLSATPVQNNLMELYNLLTLLKPGIFKTEKEFRSLFVAAGNSRMPANRERLQDLMRDAMIRNTRSLVDVHLPARQATTIRVDPSPEERDCYSELNRLIRKLRVEDSSHHHLALHHMLEAAGSSPSACSSALERFLSAHSAGGQDVLSIPFDDWQGLSRRYAGLGDGAKVEALFTLLAKNVEEKKMVFVRFQETMNKLDGLFKSRSIPFVRFDGHMTGSDKDRAVEAFRNEASVLLCSESGGEGRNLQFCNTLINFDLPWNPQVIEQRIGRLHRIGQQREVFIFNLAGRHTVEERILSILDDKINMFELVVGETQSILGEMDEEHDFSHIVFKAWIEETDEAREKAFAEIGEKLGDARKKYEDVKALDEELFGEEFEVV